MKTLQRHEMVKIKVWKTGSSLVVTIPKNLAELYGITEGSVLDFIAESKDDFSIKPVRKR
ncbi:MAG: AbrB/MazE/SpoVT family DNA-binding domain-containing protein [Candidatus Methanoperedens sp.]|nr:AbrB/MazE/SpoVT family DNA-binding domain-containing protein [Candidatus Methanoperedens sp.]